MWIATRPIRRPSRSCKRTESWARCRYRCCPYLNNVLEQDHRFVRKRIAALWFRSVEGALRTIAGYEAMNMIRKGQVRWLAKGDVVGQVRFVERTFGIAT
jgi:transposase, IS6 family